VPGKSRVAEFFVKSIVVAALMTAWLAIAQGVPAHLAAALDNPLRSAEDRAADAARKPAETMAFAGVQPGLRIAELLPGQGYYTRLLSKAVGPTGRVITIPWREFATGASRSLANDPRYGNIDIFEENLLGFRPKEPLDMVFTTQNYHDFASPQRAQVNQVLFKALKPGGIYFVLDHSGAPRSGYASLPLHRIDEALIKREIEAAGFKLEAESDLLRNPADDRRSNVFSPAIRGKTDQFLMRFRKPNPSP
jgi:predicted methyltransferase